MSGRDPIKQARAIDELLIGGNLLDLDVDVSTLRALGRAGIFTVAQLHEEFGNLQTIRGIGPVKMKKLARALVAHAGLLRGE